MSRKEFAAIMTYIGIATNKPLGDEALEVYFDLLGDLPADELQLAAKRVLQEHKWATFPTVAELRAAAAESAQGRIAELSAGEGWRLAWQAVGRIDLEQDGSLDRATKHLPPVVLEAMRVFGIAALVHGDEPVGVVRSQFVKIFEQISARERRKALMPAKMKQEILAIGERHSGRIEAIGPPQARLPVTVAGMLEGIAKPV
jgi:hypothetical protein